MYAMVDAFPENGRGPLVHDGIPQYDGHIGIPARLEGREVMDADSQGYAPKQVERQKQYEQAEYVFHTALLKANQLLGHSPCFPG